MIALSDLPTLNASLNALSAVLLVGGYAQIRARNVRAHRNFMLGAFASSVAFLVSYLVYHYGVGSVGFTGRGWIRPVYFSVLISHTVLAALVPPLALITLYRAWRGNFERHRRIARWTFPIWLYVSFTGVLVYVFLYWLYPSS